MLTKLPFSEENADGTNATDLGRIRQKANPRRFVASVLFASSFW